MKYECGETLGDLEPVYDLFQITSEFLSLITTSFRLRVNWPCQRLCHRHVCGGFVEQVVFLTVNHRGPLSLRELHSTDEIRVWRDPGGS